MLDTSSWSREQPKLLNSVFISQVNIHAGLCDNVLLGGTDTHVLKQLEKDFLGNKRSTLSPLIPKLLMQSHYVSSTHTSLNLFSLSARKKFLVFSKTVSKISKSSESLTKHRRGYQKTLFKIHRTDALGTIPLRSAHQAQYLEGRPSRSQQNSLSCIFSKIPLLLVLQLRVF